MRMPVVILIIGVLYVLTQPGAAANLGHSLELFGVIAAVALVAGLVGGVALIIQASVQDVVGEWVLRRRRARTGRSL